MGLESDFNPLGELIENSFLRFNLFCNILGSYPWKWNENTEVQQLLAAQHTEADKIDQPKNTPKAISVSETRSVVEWSHWV